MLAGQVLLPRQWSSWVLALVTGPPGLAAAGSAETEPLAVGAGPPSLAGRERATKFTYIYIFNRQNNFGRPIRIIRIMFSLLVFWVYCFVIYFSLRNLTLPNEHVAILQPLNPLIDVTELHKIHRPFDFEAAQLQIVWSGRKGIDYVQCRGYVISSIRSY